jgi:hypothetical protein
MENNNFKFSYSAKLEKSGKAKNGRIPITIVPNIPTVDRVNDLIITEAFLHAKEGYLKDGVIDYDHQSVLAESHEEKAKAIIGQPEDLYVENSIPYCDAFLFENNPYVKNSIMPALEAGSTSFGASVGGKTLKSSEEIDIKTNKEIKKITRIKLNHIAITPLYKAVHQGSSVELRKSFGDENGDKTVHFKSFEDLIKSFENPNDMYKALTAGSQTDISNISGGQTLQSQSLEGSPVRLDKMKGVLRVLLVDITAGKLKGSTEEYKKYLKGKGLNDKESKKMIELIALNTPKIAGLSLN